MKFVPTMKFTPVPGVAKYEVSATMVRGFDIKGNPVHSIDSKGLEGWREYDSEGNKIHHKDSDGFEVWFNSNGNQITKDEFHYRTKPVGKFKIP